MAQYRVLSTSGSYQSYVELSSPTGSVSFVPTGSISPSFGVGVITGDVNLRRYRERSLYNRLLNGQAYTWEVGESQQAGPLGFYLFSGSVYYYPNKPATPPSWTQDNIGLSHAFWAPALSSSQHEVTELNCAPSSSVALEVSAVPASATLYYSKQTRFVTKTYKVTGSVDLVYKISGAFGAVLSGSEAAAWPNGYFSAVSGVLLNASFGFFPVTWAIPITVPEHGKIRDIKVWLELVHDGVQNSLTGGLMISQGLGTLKVALRSPNVSGFYSVPSWNDPGFGGDNLGVKGATVASDVYYKDFYYNSFLLWDGNVECLTWAGSTGSSFLPLGSTRGPDPTVPMWDSDRNMRTIFWDSSPNANPRLLDSIFAGNGTSAVQVGIEASLSGNAPCVVGGAITGTFSGVPPVSGLAWGSQFPWTAESKLTGLNVSTLPGILTGGSPPAGWLSGPGGTNNSNEWPTTGSNLGPPTILPVYPLLDSVSEVSIAPSSSNLPYVFMGTRPGLRGTEMNGTWSLLLNTGVQTLWFRQARLEILYDTGIGQDVSTTPSMSLRFRKKNGQGQSASTRRSILRDAPVYMGTTGSAVNGIGFHHDTTFVFVQSEDTYGRFNGITSDTGSTPNFAVFTRLTGALADQWAASASLSSSGTAHALYSYLNNQFGTPYIPISSGSSVAPSFSFFNTTDSQPTKSIVSQIINPRPILPQAHTIRDVVSRLGGAISTSDAIASKILDLQSGSLS